MWEGYKMFELKADYVPSDEDLAQGYKQGLMTRQQYIDVMNKRLAQQNQTLDKELAGNVLKEGIRAGIGATLEGASFHPIFNIPYVGTGLGGALFEWGDSINNKRSAVDTLKNMGKGFAIGETVGAIPYAGKAIGKTKVGSKFGDVANKAYQRIADTSIGAKMGQRLNNVGDLLMTDVKAFNPNKQVAWHGSATDFDKFDNAYMGTGEGAQMHGLGHYTAKSKDIAEERYRKRLVPYEKEYFYDGEKVPTGRKIFETLTNNNKEDILKSAEIDVQKYNKWFTDRGITPQTELKMSDPDYFYLEEMTDKLNNAKNFLENVKKVDPDKIAVKDAGQLYQLRIPKNDVMLREEASFAEQPQAVQNAIKKLANDINEMSFADPSRYWENREKLNKMFDDRYVNLETSPEFLKEWVEKYPEEVTGNDIYNLLSSKQFGRDQKELASWLLNKYGIKGISYNGGIDGEANVIFNPDDIDIVRKYYNQPQAMEYFKSINPNLGAETEAINNSLVDKKYWKQYAKDNMIGKSVDVPDYTIVNFTNKNLNKDYLYNMPEYPTLFDQLAGSKYAFSTNYKNEPDRLYDHLVNTNNNRLFDYLIEVIKDNDGNVHHNYKMMKNITRGDKP